ncbi:hypothetical protein DY245_42460 [Streptomyces inhibens]|uniref:Uncharacterized protein n=1 Tax=Streptomyces inhibens TaxID=2293571 RepID=A0A371PQE3_STRIH|nr:hypothetical protein DY245_42460 [Streptomyces inhibens]
MRGRPGATRRTPALKPPLPPPLPLSPPLPPMPPMPPMPTTWRPPGRGAPPPQPPPPLPTTEPGYCCVLSSGRSSFGSRFSQDLPADWVSASFTQVK